MAVTRLVRIVELVVPVCTLTHGSAPCTATGTPCYNTRTTCQDKANFDVGTQSLWFVEAGNTNWRTCTGMDRPIPSLLSVSTRATRLNFSGADSSSGGLGQRSTLSITIRDHTYNDDLTDPYRSSRGYDPRTRGTFWTKWLARNDHRLAITIRVYDGEAGQDVSAMPVREYLWSEIEPPRGGEVTITATDWLAKLDGATVVDASEGVLFRDMTAGASVAKVVNAAATDYPSSGLVRIDDELIRYDSVTDTGTYLQFSLTERGAWGTTAASHDADTTVQECAEYDGTPLADGVLDLMTRGGFPLARIDTTALADEVGTYLAIHTLRTVISDPDIEVMDCLEEITVQYGLHIWWKESNSTVTFGVARDANGAPDLLTADAHIIADSFELTEHPDEWLSRVWFYYRHKTPISDLDDGFESFQTIYVAADYTAEIPEEYDDTSKTEIMSRWVDSDIMAWGVSDRRLQRFKEIPLSCSFQMSHKDRGYEVGDVVRISTPQFVDADGLPRVENWFITGTDPQDYGVTTYTARNLRTYAPASDYTGAAEADYSPGASDPDLAFWGDSDGKLSDGTDCARWF